MDPSISLIYFPSAVLLGAMHALEPGHAKTLTAAYLIGIKGTKRDAVLLGLSVAATHSVVVVTLSVVALWLGQEAFADRAGHWLQVASGVVVILLGFWMLWRRWPRQMQQRHEHHHHAPERVPFEGTLARGTVQIVETHSGERMRCILDSIVSGIVVRVEIHRAGGAIETLVLEPDGTDPGTFLSTLAPAEPHEFAATLELRVKDEQELIPFSMHEPAAHQHGHDHADLSEDEHMRAHAATMPAYVQQGLRPSAGQILAFGAAGGMIPCPASITVMLLALSVGRTALGLLMVMGFSVGLALTLVGMGLVVVMSLGRLAHSPRFAWVSRRAPLVSAGVVILSGLAALLLVH